MEPIYPPACLGILGGGQLGRYFVQAAQDLGFEVCVLDPDPLSPAGQIAQKHILAKYDDSSALREMADYCVAISTEFENVPAKTIDDLIALGVFVAPNSKAVSIAQHRVKEKQFLVDCKSQSGVGPVNYAVIDSEDACQKVADELFPGILKTAEFGYDGKGQQSVQSKDELFQIWNSLDCVQCVLEQRVDLAFEVSVIIARGLDNQIDILPISQNIHHNGILHISMVPAPDLNLSLQEKIHLAAQTIIQTLDYVGVLCIEFFVTKNGALIINEIAPRPHNSGHHSLDSCLTSQFEQQVRTLARLPLASSQLLSPVVMLNLLGDQWSNGSEVHIKNTPSWEMILKIPSAKLHLYGKAEAKVGRKMGHINFLEHSVDQAMQDARRAMLILGMTDAG
jgi:5-(carboxyamino)imidazole ribonucleotide synthase